MKYNIGQKFKHPNTKRNLEIREIVDSVYVTRDTANIYEIWEEQELEDSNWQPIEEVKEIEELPPFERDTPANDIYTWHKINELVQAINELRRKV